MMGTVKRSLTVAALVLATVGFGSAAWAARSSSYMINGAKSIGGYQVGASYTAARSVFGFPLSSSQSSATCTASFKGGVTIAWHRTLPYAKWAKACVRFSWATVGRARATDPTWQTDKGLRVGATESRLKQFYGTATHSSSTGYSVWTLAKSSKVSLQAWTKRGRIAFFKLVSG